MSSNTETIKVYFADSPSDLMKVIWRCKPTRRNASSRADVLRILRLLIDGDFETDHAEYRLTVGDNKYELTVDFIP